MKSLKVSLIFTKVDYEPVKDHRLLLIHHLSKQRILAKMNELKIAMLLMKHPEASEPSTN